MRPGVVAKILGLLFSRLGAGKTRKMKTNKSKFYFAIILFIHILVYFFKIDRDVFIFSEYIRRPNQTLTEQPIPKNASYFCSTISKGSQFSKSLVSKDNKMDIISIWHSILLAFNSDVYQKLKFQESTTFQAINIITILHKQNIRHKFSEDDPAV